MDARDSRGPRSFGVSRRRNHRRARTALRNDRAIRLRLRHGAQAARASSANSVSKVAASISARSNFAQALVVGIGAVDAADEVARQAAFVPETVEGFERRRRDDAAEVEK